MQGAEEMVGVGQSRFGRWAVVEPWLCLLCKFSQFSMWWLEVTCTFLYSSQEKDTR